MSFTTSWRFPASVGAIVLAIAIGGGASGQLTNGVAGSIAICGVLLLFDAHIGTRTLGYLAIKKPEERRVLTEMMFFSQPRALQRYLIALVSTPVMLGVVATTGLGYITGAALVICVAAYGLFSFLTLLKAWNAAAAQEERSSG